MLTLLAALLLGGSADVKVTIVQGTVEAQVAGADFAPLKPGMQLAAGCTLRTGPAAKALLEVGVGYELRIGEKTEVYLETEKKLLLRTGRLFFRVPRSAAPIEVATELHPTKLDECVAEIAYTPRVPNGAGR